MVVHNLKSWLALFHAHLGNLMPFEYRKNDRDYQPGDTLHLEEYNQITGTKTGRTLDLFVREIWTSADIPGLPEGYVIMWVVPPGLSTALAYLAYRQALGDKLEGHGLPRELAGAGTPKRGV